MYNCLHYQQRPEVKTKLNHISKRNNPEGLSSLQKTGLVITSQMFQNNLRRLPWYMGIDMVSVN